MQVRGSQQLESAGAASGTSSDSHVQLGSAILSTVQPSGVRCGWFHDRVTAAAMAVNSSGAHSDILQGLQAAKRISNNSNATACDAASTCNSTASASASRLYLSISLQVSVADRK